MASRPWLELQSCFCPCQIGVPEQGGWWSSASSEQEGGSALFQAVLNNL